MHALVAVLVLAPLMAAALCLCTRSRAIRSLIVLATGCVLIPASLLLAAHEPFFPASGASLHALVRSLDFVVLLVILAFGVRERSRAVVLLAVVQLFLVIWLEFFQIRESTAGQVFYCDRLALAMVLIISIVGSIVCVQAIPYMNNHEEHLRLARSRQPRFFFVMLSFLGAMNGMVLANDLTVFHFFFEVTTLCSFLLIAHDATPVALRHGVRALWMNSLAGVALVMGMILVQGELGTLDLQQVVGHRPLAGIALPGIALLGVASFIKSAQFPFQSWLLGAMVAPTPVSALLHSSTMVNVGVYLVLRLAPAMQSTILTHCIAVHGALAFLAGAALAVGQSNGKKVLAYSTISNLGLIFACAGLNSSGSLTAATVLIIFHAWVKALLFLCVGTIEQSIESRDIEDMRGLYARMPVTALITVMGVIMMIMPPFGLVLGKWMAMESAAESLPVIVTLAFGSALTVMYWARWAGTLMSVPFTGEMRIERLSSWTWGPVVALGVGAGGLSVLAPWVHRWLFVTAHESWLTPAYASRYGVLESSVGGFAVVPLSVVALAALLHGIWALRGAVRRARRVVPYVSGIHTGEPQVFAGPMGRMVKAEAGNFYLSTLFGEDRLTGWINLAAVLLLILILGSTL